MKNGFFVVLLSLLVVADVFGDSPSSSVLSSGDWYRMYIARDGIYRISYTELRDLGISNPADIRIYGSGGAMLPEKVGKDSGNDLEEIPVWMYTGADGIFNEGDYILFYGQGPVVWQYNPEEQTFKHSLHLWDNQSCYFITSKAGGKRITNEELSQNPPTQTVTTFDEHLYYEKELVNILKSGRYWYGEEFGFTSTYRFPFELPDIDLTEPASMNISFVAQTTTLTYLEAKYGSQQIANQPLPTSFDYQRAAETSFNTSSFHPASSNITIELTLNKNGNSNARGWLNYLRLFARRKLNMSSSQLFFRDTKSVGAGQVAGFRITNSTTNTQVWDITDMHNIRKMNTTLSGNILGFNAVTDNLREFVAFDMSSGLLKPVFPDGNRRIENQNMHAISNVDMIIVSHPDFANASQKLADLHRKKDGMAVEVVTTEQVYNEFSSGMQDPSAIRNFMKHVYEKPTAPTLKYLLLMGDGSYDNKSNLSNNNPAYTNTNYMVTYQSANSLHSTESYVSDDFFGILGDHEPVGSGKLNIGIGRLPVQTSEQAMDAVNKIHIYINTKVEGDWPNLMGLLADDEDNNQHTSQSESLANYVELNHPQYTIEKLYLDAFPQVATVNGHRYPEVEQRLNNLLDKGCLLVNYIGHGNEKHLAEEWVVSTATISQWKNKIYPLFVVATCEFGRYDDNAMVTAGESMVLKAQGGSIALLTSTRLVYSNLNFQLNSSFLRELLAKPEKGDEHRLGDILRRAKNALDPSVNKLCFTLLGDPALKPVIPSDSIQTVSINGKLVNEPIDTLKANAKVTVRGYVTGADGQIQTGFNGTMHFSLFDKAREAETLNNDGNAPPMTFTTQNSILYKGKTTVDNGEFEISFMMPRDINYQYGFGKMSYYAYADDGAAAGAFEKVVVGGSESPAEDNLGPEIRLFMNDISFRDGGMTDQSPLLIAYLQDEHGINTSNEGIGHGITAVLNSNPDLTFYLNPYYEADLNSHNKGVVTYRFNDLPVGNYDLLFTAWDLENNPSQANLRFRVAKSSVLQIDKLYNYPNPFSEVTNIYFEYNMPDTEIQLELQIFDMSGRLLRSMKQSLFSPGYTSGQFHWDGHDANGNRMKAGIYPYRVILRTQTGQTVWQTSKMAIGQ